MKKVSIIVARNRIQATKQAQRALIRLFVHYKKLPILFLTSGGSAFALLDRFPVQAIPLELTLGVLDERYSRDPKVNNFLQLQRTKFFSNVLQKQGKYIETIPTKKETLQHFAKRFNHELRTWRKRYPKGKVIVTLGMGADGHTAGMMPYPEAPKRFRLHFETPLWVRGYDAKKKSPYSLRATTTVLFLRNHVDDAVAFVCGGEKKRALSRVVARKGSLAETPMRIVRSMRSVRVFTDIRL